MNNIVTRWFVVCCWAALSHCATQNNRRAIDNILSATSNGGNQTASVQQRQEAVLPVGEAFNLFQSYGLLAFNINVGMVVMFNIAIDAVIVIIGI